jgi:hypothetical protein
VGLLAAAVLAAGAVVLVLTGPSGSKSCTAYIESLPELKLVPTRGTLVRSIESAPPPSGAALVVIGGSSGGLDASPQPPQARWYFRMPDPGGDAAEVQAFFARALASRSWTAQGPYTWTKGDAELSVSNAGGYFLPGLIKADSRYWLVVERFGSPGATSIPECHNDDRTTYPGNGG